MDFDAVWDAWMAAGHGDCGGWRHDPGPAVVTCACGTIISGTQKGGSSDA